MTVIEGKLTSEGKGEGKKKKKLKKKKKKRLKKNNEFKTRIKEIIIKR